MHDQNFTSLPDLHGVPVFYPHGTQLIWISPNGEITRPSRETLASEFALGVVLLCHRRWSAARAAIDIDHYWGWPAPSKAKIWRPYYRRLLLSFLMSWPAHPIPPAQKLAELRP
jgi:hypothetical protein